MSINYPKVHTDSKDRVFVSIYINKKRYRIYNGKRIGSTLDPNSFPPSERLSQGNVLAAELYNYIQGGGLLTNYRSYKPITGELSDKEYLNLALESKLKGNYSNKYKDTLQRMHSYLLQAMKGQSLAQVAISSILNRYDCNVSYNTNRRHLMVLINEAVNLGMDKKDLGKVRGRKAKAKLHKPFDNITAILEEIKHFNRNLYICCLMTYGCLLRPHREVRELTWGDFTEDLSYINLSGERNKSGKNRIVPVPKYVRQELIKGAPHVNVFSGKPKPMNEDYFKTLWGRFRKQSEVLEEGQTLYSFRHTGAIDIFKRTGSITKLQKAMGHSSINVSLVYLRGLEVAELMEEDMPRV